mmetsp:Transcript_13071/g.28814  ORF Transcript_13071/g.28814 Transcript_13071/m.28814 type:complete len:131 (-) Transcript_13071:1942-2334(-)
MFVNKGGIARGKTRAPADLREHNIGRPISRRGSRCTSLRPGQRLPKPFGDAATNGEGGILPGLCAAGRKPKHRCSRTQSTPEMLTVAMRTSNVLTTLQPHGDKAPLEGTVHNLAKKVDIDECCELQGLGP